MDTAKAANLYSTYPADLLTYVNPPIGGGHAAARAAQAAHRGAHDRRHRARRPPAWPSSTSRRCTPRPASPTGACGPCWASSTRSTPTRCRPWSPPRAASTCCRTPWSRTPRSRPPRGRGRHGRPCARVPGQQPVLGHLGGAGHHDGRALPAARRGAPGRRRGARGDEPRGDVRGHRLRQRGRPSAARHVLRGVGRRARVPAGGLSAGPRHGAPRHVRGAQRAVGVPLHRVRRTRRVTCGRRS